jgi:hypothetical protein
MRLGSDLLLCRTLHLRAATRGDLNRCRRFGPMSQNKGQRTLNRGLSRPVMKAWYSRNHVSGKATERHIYFVVPFSWGNASEQAGEAMNPYCVILWPEPLVNPVSYPRTKRFFLRAYSADGAIQAALADNPHWRALALSLEICLLAFYKVLLHALNLTIGTLPESTPRSGRKRSSSLLFRHPAPAILSGRGIWQLCLQSCSEHHTVHKCRTDVALKLIRRCFCLTHLCLNILFDNAPQVQCWSPTWP